MKKLLSLLLCMMLLSSVVITAVAAPGTKNMGTVPGTAAALKLDGTRDAAYNKGLKIDGSTLADGSKSAATLHYWVTYTKDALWIFVEVKDSTIVVKNKDEAKPSYLADSIEIMLDPTNEGKNEADVTPYQMRIDSYNLISARKGQKGTSLYLRKADGGNIDFFDAVSVKTSGGFNAEYKIPLSDLKAGKQIGFTFCYNDWDTTGANRTVPITTLGEKSNSWTPELYNYMVLGEIAAETAATQKTPTATGASAATMDIAVVLATACAIAASGVIVTKKKR